MSRRFSSMGSFFVRPPVRGRGFTLVELLVVIAIIGTLIGLLLPAVQSARASARRMQCINNLRTLGQGLMTYESARRNFPPGATSNGVDLGSSGLSGGAYTWGSLILPFIEEAPLYDGIKPTSAFPTTVAAQPLLATPLKAFRCPEDRGPATFSAPLTAVGQPDDTGEYIVGGGLTNYVAAVRAVPVLPKYTTSSDPARGGFFMNSKTKVKDITDGTSKSIAVSERVWEYPPSYRRDINQKLPQAGTWAGAQLANSDGSWAMAAGFAPSKAINDNTAGRSHRSLSSLHAGGGVNSVSFDGSARFISDNIDHALDPVNFKNPNDPVNSVFEYLVAIADGIAFSE
jgi:prepilin-type N-terminal cleavage/methylation domain-containing protein